MTTTSDIIRFPPAGWTSSRERGSPPFSRHVSPDFSRTGEVFDTIYFVCCDSRYFNLFAEPLANSIARNSGLRCLLHVHVVNPDDLTRASMNLLKPRETLAIATSFERTKLDHLSRDQRRTYYACARFFMLAELRAKYRAPIIVADIDQLVVKDLSAFLATARAKDVTLIHFPRWRDNLLSLVSASMIVISDTPNGTLFCLAVERYLAERMSNPLNLSWHLDQAALAVTLLTMPSSHFNLVGGETIGIGIDAKAIEASSALFWTITYSDPSHAAKIESPEFQAYA